MPPIHFPLRWESTGDHWWYASPIDYAAANGHYDLVRELLRIDSNHLIKLTSLRRIRRLETVWDDEAQFNNVATCRSKVARKLFLECESKKGKNKNSLIRGGYGGWLIYTAASAGDVGFVKELLERNPLLVFGEGEYGVTDILYAAARSKNCEVFRVLYDFAMFPRFLRGKGGGTEMVEESIAEISDVYKWEMVNRGVHAAARGGNLDMLKEILGGCSDVLAYRDKQGCTILHAAAGRGQVEVVKALIGSFVDIINAIDHQGNTALHTAAYRGQLSVVEALILKAPSLISIKNRAGETFLHATVSGFRTPAFRRLDRQMKLMKQLVCEKSFNMDEIINAQNNEGRTALHMAITENVQTDLVQLLMSARSIDVNIRDSNGMTPLDLLKQRPRSASSDILLRHLISAGGIFSSQDYHSTRRAIATQLKMQGDYGSSPGTLFRVLDTEIFLYTGIDASWDVGSARVSASSLIELDSANEKQNSTVDKNSSNSVNVAAQRLKSVFHWPRLKKLERSKKSLEELNSVSEVTVPIPLRERFSKPSSLPNNKRTLSVRSNQSSPTAKKKFASGLVHGVIQAIPQVTVRGRSRSSSFSKSSSISSRTSVERQKGTIFVQDEVAEPSCSSNQMSSNEQNPKIIEKQASKRLKSQYFCFGGSSLSVRNPVSRHRHDHNINPPILSTA